MYLFAHLIYHGLQVKPDGGQFAGLGFRTQRVGLAVELLHQEVELAPSGPLFGHKRARRRHKELEQEGRDISLAQVEEELAARDERDAARRDAPATKAEDAVLIDTTDLTIDAAVDQARAVIEAALATKQAASEQ